MAATEELLGLLGPNLQTKDGVKPTSDVLKDKKAVLLYFSAHWCPPCRGFTPILAKAYNEYAAKDVEVVFVSSDRDQAGFDEYYGEMPWACLPYSDRGKKDELATKFGVRGIPMLVVLKPDGTVASENGRGEVQGNPDMKAALGAWGL
ncbi:Nxn [Symbiodinium natans]|uniref:protein-disulfide reductase n=1 Tax=Symbiodinium natans TaxID=878477 RepID=A0A812ILQ8_9DINO|nr:Nxn [Symbiodinium natans]